MTADRHVDAGRAALALGRWDEALTEFEVALAENETGDALAGAGAALWWLCRNRPSIQYRERAFAAYRREGNTVLAATAGVDLAISYLINLGNGAAANGWLAKAERVMSGIEPNPVQGWLLLVRGFLSAGRTESVDLLERALDFALESGDVDLELIARSDLGLELVAGGQVEEGIRLLDEAMAGTLAGEGRKLETIVYTSCNMLAACRLTGDLDRASQWCRAADDFMERYQCPFMFANCRAHYGGVLVAKGEWARAEHELIAALRIAEQAGPGIQHEALARLAELRVRQGRLEEAETLIAQIDDPLAATIPAATAHLRAGEPGAAVALLQRRLERSAGTALDSAQVLALLVDAFIADGRVQSAADAADALDILARRLERGSAHALAAIARARVALAVGDGEAAAADLEFALELLAPLNLPFETATARLDLARAASPSRREVAIIEATAARTAFERLGAQPGADAASALLRALGAGGRTGPRHAGILTKREQEVLQLLAAGLSNPEIAQRLYISRKTVSHHVSRILTKLGLRNRAEAVAYVARQPAPN